MVPRGGIEPPTLRFSASRFAHLMHDGRDGERPSRPVSDEEQRERYAARREAEEKLIERQRWYYSERPEDDQ